MNRDLASLQAYFGPHYRKILLTVLLMGSMVTALSSTSINVALPEIMRTFDMQWSMAQWLATGFLAAMTAGLLLAAWAQSKLGSLFTMQISIGLFLMCSVFAFIATDGWHLVILRTLQGFCSGIIQPLATVLIFRVYDEGQRGRALGLYALGLMIAPTLGPTVGGFLVDAFGWQASFWLPMPVCIVILMMASWVLPDERTKTSKKLDVLGFSLLTIAIFSSLGGLAEAQQQSWFDPTVYIPLVLAVVCTVLFFIVSHGKPHAVLPVHLWLQPAFRRASWIAFALGAGLFGSTYLLPVYLQVIEGFSAGASGLILLPAGLFLGFASFFSGWLCDRISVAWLVIAGLILFALSIIWFGFFAVGTGAMWLAIWAGIGRAGLGLLSPAINTASLQSLAKDDLAYGAGAITFVRQIGGAFGINLLTAFLQWRYTHLEGAEEGLLSVAYEHTFLLFGAAFLLALWPAWRLRPAPLHRAEARYQRKHHTVADSEQEQEELQEQEQREQVEEEIEAQIELPHNVVQALEEASEPLDDKAKE